VRTSTSFSSAGFILHRYPYKETSYILETFTRTHGRVAMVAKGAKRGSASKYALNAFQPVTINWFGRADLKTLKTAEHDGIYPQLRGSALMAAFYVNELILKLAVKDDPHEVLFDAYDALISSLSQIAPLSVSPAMPTTMPAAVPPPLASTGRTIETNLRHFELTMLAELGYALTLDFEANSNIPIDAALNYYYVVDEGPIRYVLGQKLRAHEPVLLSGQTLIALSQAHAAGQLDAATPTSVLLEAKQLMRRVINHHLGDKALHTRQLMREMR